MSFLYVLCHALNLSLQDRAREVKDASERVAREAARQQAEIAMNGVVKVQDRLVQALQTELEMVTVAREAAQVC